MKKIMCVVLTLVMVVSVFTTASATKVSDYIDVPDNAIFAEFELPIYVQAKKVGDSEWKTAADGFSISSETLETSGVDVDFQAKLDMQQIRDIFDMGYLSSTEDFNSGMVSTDVTVTVVYDDNTVTNPAAGVLIGLADEVYQEVGRSQPVDAGNGKKKIEIAFKQKNDISITTLIDENLNYLSDITFELLDAVEYNAAGNFGIQVSLEGKTKFVFDSKTVNVAYRNAAGSGNFVVNAAVAHFLKVVPAVPATCDTPGKTESVICETHNSYNCGANGTQPQGNVDPLNHKYDNGSFATHRVERVEATCIKEGNVAHYVCLLCKATFSDASATTPLANVKNTKTAHTLGTSYPRVNATCTEDGLTAGQKCEVCGYETERKIIPATGHNLVPDAAVPAKCTVDGLTEGKHCTNPGCTYEIAQNVVLKLGHSFGEWVVTTPATATTTGLMERTCTRSCGETGHTETKVIPAIPHSDACVANPALKKEIAATCDTPGSRQNYCDHGLPVGEPEVIPAAGHSTTHVAGRAATCAEEGIVDHYACGVCGKLFRHANGTGEIKDIIIPLDKSNHLPGFIRPLPAVAPTCDKDGLTAGSKCSKCNTIIDAQEKVAKLKDDPEANYIRVSGKAATCNENGEIEHWHCSVCDKNYTIHEVAEINDCSIPKTGHAWGEVEVITPSTETVPGVGQRICSNDPSHIITVDLALAQHVHNEECEEILQKPTCTIPGKKVMRFTCCGEIDINYPGSDANGIIPIPASHSFVVVEIPSTCFKEGTKKHNYCPVCDKAFDFETGLEITNLETLKTDKLVHSFELHHENANFIFNKCSICNEMVKIPKENKANTKGHGGIKSEADDIKEQRANEEKAETGREIVVESVITIDKREISTTLETNIHSNDTEDKKASTDKVVLEITVETVTKHFEYKDDNGDDENDIDTNDDTLILDKDTKVHEETPSLIEIEIPIPVEMRGFVDFLVHRMHNGVAQTLRTAPNTDGEYIEIASDKSTVTIFVKKFSEYAVVGYETKVNPDPVTPSTGGGGSSSFIIKLNANGGTLLDDVKVKYGEKAELPTPVRDGYVFAGWYLDSNFTTPFDANTVINKNYTLYAKWTSLDECTGTAADGCPCLKFYDLDPTMWYHRGVDYVLNRGMMNGVATTQFAPNLNVSRAMLVTVLWRAEGMPAVGSTTFTDLEDGLYYVDAVKWATANGVVNGYSDTVFAPNDAITREQFAAIMYRYAKNKGYDLSAGENTNILSYTDWPYISDYALEAMQYTLGSGLITGRTETTLNPKDNTTRAEMATILYRFFTESK